MDSEFTLDGITYTYTHMTTKVSLHLQLRLGKVIGPALRGLLAGGEQSPQAMGGSAVSELLANLDESTLDATILAFAKQCQYTDESGNYRLDKCWEQHFAGRHIVLFKWLGECASLEWADFFIELTRLLAGPPTPVPSPSVSPQV